MNFPGRRLPIFYNGALFEEEGEAGIGVMVCNHRGEVMASLSERIQKPSSMVTLEMLAARRAVLFTQEFGIGKSMFEGDPEIVINAPQRGNMFNFAFGHLIKDNMSFINSFQS